MNTKQLRECPNERLEELERNLRKEIFEARIRNFTNQLDDTASLKRARRERARILTIMNERAAGTGPTADDTASEEATEGTE